MIWRKELGGPNDCSYIMKAKFVRHMKNFIKFVTLILIYYVFLYCIARGFVMMVARSFDTSFLVELGCHLFAIVFVLLTITTYEDNENNRPNTV